MLSIDQYITDEINNCATNIARRLDETGTTASGKTRDSIRVEVGENIYTIFGRSYFGTVETGRGSGKVPGNMTDIIKEWAIAKKIGLDPIAYIRKPSDKWQPKYTPEQRALNAFAGAVSHKIATEGGKLYRDGGRADIYSEEIRATMERIVKNVGAIYKTQIIESIKLNS